MDIIFPSSPTLGQEYVANTVTYVWLGDRWSSKLLVTSGQPIIDGGYSGDEFNENIDQILDGGGA
jgi:hypothetical protein